MKTKKQNADFLHVGSKLLNWFAQHGRDLPFRKTRDPYKIWICEIIFQQTRIEQGMTHYQNFIARFPDVQSLAIASNDEVLLYWKGLGYYSRAINLHTAAKQIVNQFSGIFPNNYEDILSLKGVGKYTAAAISSICFNEQRPAIDGNFYRVLSRVFADDFDISKSGAFEYFSELSYMVIPLGKAGIINEAVMDLGSMICKPKKPLCNDCPIQNDCLAFQTRKIEIFPVKTKKTKPTDLALDYYFVEYAGKFLSKQRSDDFIWKKLYEFPMHIPTDWQVFVRNQKTIRHQLTHKNLCITIHHVEMNSLTEMNDFAENSHCFVMDEATSQQKSFPKPLENYLTAFFDTSL